MAAFSDDFAKKLSAGMGAGGAVSGLMGLFGGGGDDPMKAANPFFNKIPGTMEKYMNPYIDSGKNAMGTLNKTYGNLLNDPGSIMAQIGKGYQKSPTYDFERTEGLQGINNAAAAGGMLGTPQHQSDAGSWATNFANKDYGDYLNHALGLWGAGLSGTENMNKMGFEGSEDMARNLSQLLAQQGNMAFQGVANKNQQKGDFMSQIGGGIGMALPFLLG
jgi:hypothetical protein